MEKIHSFSRDHTATERPCLPWNGAPKLPCQHMPSLQPAHGGPQFIPSPERSKELLSGKSNSPAKHRSGHESARTAISMPGLCMVYSLPWKVKAIPGLKDRGGVSAKRLQHTQQPHTFLTHTHTHTHTHTPRAFWHQSHLLCTSVMLMMAHDSVLPTGPQEVEMGYRQEGGRASGLGEEWKRMTGPFPEKGRNSNTGPGLGFLLGSTSLHLSPQLSHPREPRTSSMDIFSLSPDSLYHLHPFLMTNPLLAMSPRFLSTSQNPLFPTHS